MSLWTPLRYLVVIMYLFSQSLSIVLRCLGQLLNVTFSFLSARCIRWSSLIWVYFLCIIDVMLLYCFCCKRLILTWIIASSVRFDLILPEFDIFELRPKLISSNLKYELVESPNLQGDSSRPKFVCGMTFPTVFDAETFNGFNSAVNSWLVPRVMFFQIFRSAGACGTAKAIYKQFCLSYFGLGCWF